MNKKDGDCYIVAIFYYSLKSYFNKKLFSQKDIYPKDIYPKDIYPFIPLWYNANVPINKKHNKKPNLIQINYWLNNMNNV